LEPDLLLFCGALKVLPRGGYSWALRSWSPEVDIQMNDPFSMVLWGIAIPAAILALLVWWGDRKEARSKNQR
jgi:hypothetical protein